MHITEIRWDGVDCTTWAQGFVQWRAFVTAVMNRQFTQKGGVSSTAGRLWGSQAQARFLQLALLCACVTTYRAK